MTWERARLRLCCMNKEMKGRKRLHDEMKTRRNFLGEIFFLWNSTGNENEYEQLSEMEMEMKMRFLTVKN